MNEPLNELVLDAMLNRGPEELALGWLRYKALRKLGPHQFGELHQRNLRGERFDDMVDLEVLKRKVNLDHLCLHCGRSTRLSIEDKEGKVVRCVHCTEEL